MITEPDDCSVCDDCGWGLRCDNCGTWIDIDADPGDRETLERWARDEGWIILMDYWHYCCLNCLLRHRHYAISRHLQAGYARNLAEARR